MNQAGSYVFGSRAPLPRPLEGVRAASGQPGGARFADPFGLPLPSASPSPLPSSKPGAAFAPPVRMDEVYGQRARPFPLIDNRRGNVNFQESLAERMAKTLQVAASPLVRAFFSEQNLETVQRLLRDAVRSKTGFAIDRQSDEQLLIVMRAVFADRAANVPRDVPAEVRRLNEAVISTLFNGVVSNMTAHLAYLRDASRLRTPIERGAATSIKGLRTTASLFRPL